MKFINEDFFDKHVSTKAEVSYDDKNERENSLTFDIEVSVWAIKGFIGQSIGHMQFNLYRNRIEKFFKHIQFFSNFNMNVRVEYSLGCDIHRDDPNNINAALMGCLAKAKGDNKNNFSVHYIVDVDITREHISNNVLIAFLQGLCSLLYSFNREIQLLDRLSLTPSTYVKFMKGRYDNNIDGFFDDLCNKKKLSGVLETKMNFGKTDTHAKALYSLCEMTGGHIDYNTAQDSSYESYLKQISIIPPFLQKLHNGIETEKGYLELAGYDDFSINTSEKPYKRDVFIKFIPKNKNTSVDVEDIANAVKSNIINTFTPKDKHFIAWKLGNISYDYGIRFVCITDEKPTDEHDSHIDGFSKFMKKDYDNESVYHFVFWGQNGKNHFGGADDSYKITVASEQYESDRLKNKFMDV